MSHGFELEGAVKAPEIPEEVDRGPSAVAGRRLADERHEAAAAGGQGQQRDEQHQAGRAKSHG